VGVSVFAVLPGLNVGLSSTTTLSAMGACSGLTVLAAGINFLKSKQTGCAVVKNIALLLLALGIAWCPSIIQLAKGEHSLAIVQTWQAATAGGLSIGIAGFAFKRFTPMKKLEGVIEVDEDETALAGRVLRDDSEDEKLSHVDERIGSDTDASATSSTRDSVEKETLAAYGIDEQNELGGGNDSPCLHFANTRALPNKPFEKEWLFSHNGVGPRLPEFDSEMKPTTIKRKRKKRKRITQHFYVVESDTGIEEKKKQETKKDIIKTRSEKGNLVEGDGVNTGRLADTKPPTTTSVASSTCNYDLWH